MRWPMAGSKAGVQFRQDYHWRLAISDSAPSVRTRCPGWLYAHIDPTRTHKNIGDEVNTGDTIGYAVPWPVTGFDHCHFARISDTGTTWSRFPDPTWWFTDNPLLIIQPTLDTVAPTIQDARTGQRFALCHNNTNTYFNDLNSIIGDVDIVVRAYDKTGVTCGDATWDKLQPYKYVWSVRGSVDSEPATLGIIFSGLLPTSTDLSLTGVVFKETSPCVSLGDYDSRDYFNIATNNDGDSTIEIRDTSGCWRSWEFPDDAYWVKVTVSDVAGNSKTDSMLVHTANGNGIAEVGSGKDWHNLNIPTLARSGAELAVSFDLPYAQRARLELYDPSGRLGVQFARTGILRREARPAIYGRRHRRAPGSADHRQQPDCPQVDRSSVVPGDTSLTRLAVPAAYTLVAVISTGQPQTTSRSARPRTIP